MAPGELTATSQGQAAGMAVPHMSQFLRRRLSFVGLQRAGQWQEGGWVSLGVSQALGTLEKGQLSAPAQPPDWGGHVGLWPSPRGW